MKLTPRLQAVVDKVPPSSRVVDIGTDHGYIPVYLLMNHISSSVIATDSRPGPLQAAKETLDLFNLSQAVELRMGDGLSVLKEEDDVDAIIIAGLGGDTIRTILAEGLDFLDKEIVLILQPMTNVGSVRIWLSQNGFTILQEDIADEEDDYYEVIVAALTGETCDIEENLLATGPVLVAERHPLLQPMLRQRLERLEAAIASARISCTPAAQERAQELERRAQWVEQVLSWL